MPCEHTYHQTETEFIGCSLARIADALEAIYAKLPDVGTPKDAASFVHEADKLINSQD
jgi:hypothetical protein